MSASQYIALLEQHSIRPTANRLLIVKALAAAGRPLSLGDLEKRLLTVDKSSIFRALTLFRQCHLVHAIEGGADGVRYELCLSRHSDVDDDRHVHFFCERCQHTFCLDDIAVPQVSLPEGYTLSEVTYILRGVCQDCAGR